MSELSRFLAGCVSFMTHRAWFAYLLNFGFKPALIGIIAVAICAVILGVVALIAWPIGGGAVALGILFGNASMEALISCALPLLVGLTFLTVYGLAWVVTAAVMLSACVVYGIGFVALEIGSAIAGLVSLIFSASPKVGQGNPNYVPLEPSSEHPDHSASVSASAPAVVPVPPTAPSDGRASSVGHRRTSAFYSPAPDAGSAGRSAPQPSASLEPMSYPPAVPGMAYGGATE